MRGPSRTLHSEASLTALEEGFTYTSAVAIERREVVGTVARAARPPSCPGVGFMDLGLAHALINALSETYGLLTGGAAYLAGVDPFNVGVEGLVEGQAMRGRLRPAGRSSSRRSRTSPPYYPQLGLVRCCRVGGSSVARFMEGLKAELEGLMSGMGGSRWLGLRGGPLRPRRRLELSTSR